MDFLKIRRKAKERAARTGTATSGAVTPSPAAEGAVPAQAGPAASPVAPIAAPAAVAPTPPAAGRPGPPALLASSMPGPPIRALPGSPEALRREAEVGARVAALPFAPDARFVTWRPDGSGLPDLEAMPPPEEPRPLVPEVAPPSVPLAPLDEFFYREDEPAPGLELLGPEAAAGELLAPVVLEEYLIFRLAGETYGLEIRRVLEVLHTPRITEVPRAPADVLGVITVRGEVITVVDPRGRIGLPRAEGPPANRVLIVDDGEGTCGLLVDQVAGVVRLPRGALEPCPQALGSGGGEVFLGIGRDRDRLFLVLAPGPLLRPLRRTAEVKPG